MKKQRVRLRTLAVVALTLISVSSALSSYPSIAHAQPGVCHLDGTGKLCGVFLRPGVRDEFKSNSTVAWSHTLDTLRGAQGGPAQRQQVIERYLDYAILASMSESIGDFQFDIWTVQNVSDIRIYLPSNFTFAHVASGYGDAITSDMTYSVWTDITNDYSYISVAIVADDDPIAPGWIRIEVGRIPTIGSPIPSFTIRPGLHHIRLFQVRAPFAAGLYHFKIYVDGTTIGDGNFPIVIVKSSLQPAYVTGLVSLQGLLPPTNASGRVVATGATSAGKYAEAVAYFGPKDFEAADAHSSRYRYWMFGLPAGTFDLTGSASGFLKVSERLVVEAAQSLRLDLELEKGVQVGVTIWSKDCAHLIPWANLWQPPYGTNNPCLAIDDAAHHRDILLRLLDQYDETVGYWASDDIDAPYGPPWTAATVDGKRSYSPWILKPSTLPSSTSYTATLTDVRGLPSVRLDGHVPADTADLIEGIGPGSYTLEMQVTGYIMQETDDWQRSLTIAANTRNVTLTADLRRSSWINATAIVQNSQHPVFSSPTLLIETKGTDGLDRGLAAGVFPANQTQFTIVLEGFNGAYNGLRRSLSYQDYGYAPVDYYLEIYMADMGNLTASKPGVGWYLAQEDVIELHLDGCATEALVAFHLEASSIEFMLRSVRMQQPIQPAPWMFPGAGITFTLVDELGNPAHVVSPLYYGLVQDDGTIGSHYDFDTTPVGWHGLLRIVFTGIDPGPVLALVTPPTRIMESKYSVFVSTLGYIQRYDCSVYIRPRADNDFQIDLVQGSHIRVELDFKHENVATGFNGFARVEVYNQIGTLVGASVYAGAAPNANLNYLPYDPLTDWKLVPGPAEGAGNAAQPQRAFISRMHYLVPPVTWANWPGMIRNDANRLSVPVGSIAAFDVFGFHSYYGGSDSRIDALWANGWDTTDGTAHADSGIRGSGDMLDLEGWGGFTVRVWAFDPYGPDGVFDSTGPDGVFGTDDDYTSPDPNDSGLSDFRAYAAMSETTNVEAPWGNSVAVRVTLEEQPSLLGVVYWLDMYSDLRTLPWAQVIERSSGDTWTSSATGSYRIWLSKGSHEFLVTTIGEEALWEPAEFEIVLAGGGVHVFRDVTLAVSSTTAPEFPSSTMAMIAPFATSLILFSRLRRNTTRNPQSAEPSV